MAPQIETDTDINVRSQYEKTCVEFFTETNIQFQYEPLMVLEGKQYRPDFFLPEYNLFIEICGYGHMPHYNKRVEFKEQIYKRNNLIAVFIHYNGKGSLKQILLEQLKHAGIHL